MFETILIANRGEIACRIIKTAKKMGIKAIAIYSDVDENARFVRLADASYPLDGVDAQSTYLNIEKIIEIAKKSGARVQKQFTQDMAFCLKTQFLQKRAQKMELLSLAQVPMRLRQWA